MGTPAAVVVLACPCGPRDHAGGRARQPGSLEAHDVLAGDASDLALNSVAESGQPGSLHPGGAPIIHSTNPLYKRSWGGAVDGFPSLDGRTVRPPLHSYAMSESVVPGLPVEPLPLLAVAFRLFRLSPSVGVGSNGEDPVTAVRGADGSCRYAIPDDVVPERGQVPENLSPHGSSNVA
jgi:hypothetical protein